MVPVHRTLSEDGTPAGISELVAESPDFTDRFLSQALVEDGISDRGRPRVRSE